MTNIDFQQVLCWVSLSHTCFRLLKCTKNWASDLTGDTEGIACNSVRGFSLLRLLLMTTRCQLQHELITSLTFNTGMEKTWWSELCRESQIKNGKHLECFSCRMRSFFFVMNYYQINMSGVLKKTCVNMAFMCKNLFLHPQIQTTATCARVKGIWFPATQTLKCIFSLSPWIRICFF